MENILEVNNVTIAFGGLVAVNKVTLQQKKGEILALIGPNGAGKTTLFNLLTGVYKPNYGSIIFNKENITHNKEYDRSKKGLARTFQNIRLFESMTVLENVLAAHPDCNSEGILKAFNFSKKLKRNRKRIVEECEEILDAVGILDCEDNLAVNLSYGKQRLLEIARALITKPKLILLDEPGAGMNSFEKDELTKVIHYIIDKLHVSVLLIEHDMRFVMSISNRVIVLEHGEIIAEGTPKEVQQNQKVIDAYIGSGNIDID